MSTHAGDSLDIDITGIAEAHRRAQALIEESADFLEDHGRRLAIEPARPLRLALAGQYNAGKSTLVNGLLGKSAAATGDAPETRTAHVYRHGEFDIVDLPGFDARDDEGAEAMRALREAHVVLYVVSAQSGLDQATFWERLRQLQTTGVPFVVVINDKQPYQDDDEERAERERLTRHFVSESIRQLPGDRPPAFWVNAARAEQGRTRGHIALLDRSGVLALDRTVSNLLRSSEPLLRDARHLATALRELRSVKQEVDGRLEDPRSRALTRLLDRCDDARERLIASATLIADEHLIPLETTLAGQMARAIPKSDADRAKVEKASAAELERLFAAAASAFEHESAERLTRLASEASEQLETGRFDRDIPLSVGGIPGVAADKFDLKSHLKSMGSAVGARKFVEDLVEQAAAPSAAHATVKVTARRLGVLAAVAAAAWDIYQGYRAAEEQRRQLAGAVREVDARARQAAAMARHHFVVRAAAFVTAAIAPIERITRDRLEQCIGDAHRWSAASSNASRLIADAEELCALAAPHVEVT